DGGLAGAVGADHADLRARVEAHGHVIEDDLVAHGLAGLVHGVDEFSQLVFLFGGLGISPARRGAAPHGTGLGARLYPQRCASRRCGDRNMPGATPAGAPWCAQRRSGWSLERHAALGEETTSRRGTVLGALGVGVAVARPQVGVDAERPRGVHVLPAVVEEDDR